MKGVHFLVLVTAVLGLASAADPPALQDFCVAVDHPSDAGLVNGKFCKDPKEATANDFSFSGLNPGNTKNQLGINISVINADKIGGLNTLGISLARKDYAPKGGLNSPHIHPRASEIFLVVEGTFYAGFVTSNPNNRLISKVLKAGDVFVFPVGLIHFEMNIGETDGIAVAGLSSQNPGIITVSNAVFGSDPSINPDLLVKAFQLDKNVVNYLQNKF